MTWKCWLLCSVVLAAMHGTATAQESTRNENACRSCPAPYYDQIADILFPPQAAHSEPRQWVRLFRAMEHHRRSGHRVTVIVAAGWSECRPTQEPSMSFREMLVAYNILADVENPPVRRTPNMREERNLDVFMKSKESMTATLMHGNGASIACNPDGIEGLSAPLNPTGSKVAGSGCATYNHQPDAACAELGVHGKCNNPHHISRPCDSSCIPTTGPIARTCQPRGYGCEGEARCSNIAAQEACQTPVTTGDECEVLPAAAHGACNHHHLLRTSATTQRQGLWFVSGPGIHAQANSATRTDRDHYYLQGNVVIELNQDNAPAKILTQRALINIHDGSYEVMPLNVDIAPPPVKPTVSPLPWEGR